MGAKLRLFNDAPAGGCTRSSSSTPTAPMQTRVIAAATASPGHDIRTSGREVLKTRLRDARTGRLRAGARSRRAPTASRRVRLPLAGAFQVANALSPPACAGHARRRRDPDAVFAALDQLTGCRPHGARRRGRRGAVFVDYAHKPDALEKVLAALRPFASGQLVVVFGCGGDRDPASARSWGRRRAARRRRDRHRRQPPLRGPRRDPLRDPRRCARRARDRRPRQGDPRGGRGAGPGDVLVVAGKGHETGQIVGDRVLPFSDHEAVRAETARPCPKHGDAASAPADRAGLSRSRRAGRAALDGGRRDRHRRPARATRHRRPHRHPHASARRLFFAIGARQRTATTSSPRP